MDLRGRIRTLERGKKPPGHCEVCGMHPEAPLRVRISFAEPPTDGPDECPGCGRPLVQRIVVEQVQ